ncbi:MAG: hypothetical protein MHM6MM_007284 [Cercozoa sp. M6MM]
MLSDWRSESNEVDPAPLAAEIKAEDGKLRLHAYTLAEHHDGPMNVDILRDGFELAADDMPAGSGGNFTRSIRFPAVMQEAIEPSTG